MPFRQKLVNPASDGPDFRSTLKIICCQGPSVAGSGVPSVDEVFYSVENLNLQIVQCCLRMNPMEYLKKHFTGQVV